MYREHHIDIDGHVVNILARVLSPTVIVLGNVLTAIECQRLVDMATPKLHRSTADDLLTARKTVLDRRTSASAHFLPRENECISRIENRLCRLSGLPVANAEGIQVSHYRVGEEYAPHLDYFPPDSPGFAKVFEQYGQRIATALVYLNNVESGGETVFPDLSFVITPQMGGGVFFSYPEESIDVSRRTLHAGAPVLSGEKWIVTLWWRCRAQRARMECSANEEPNA